MIKLRHFTCSLALAAVVALISGCTPVIHHTQDCQDMQGGWRVVAATKEGQEVVDNDLAKLRTIRIVVDEHTVTPCCLNEGCPGSASFILDDTARPKTITLNCRGNSCTCSGRKIVKGLYTYSEDRNTLYICVANDGDRPTEIESEPGSINSIYVLQREAADLTPEPIEPAPVVVPVVAPVVVEPVAEPTITLIDTDTHEAKVVPADTKIVFPDERKLFKNGVLEVWFPNRDIADVTVATKKAIAQLNHTETNTSMQGEYDGGSIIFGKAADNTLYTSTMAAGGNYTLVRIHYGDWGNIEESTRLAYKISENL